MKKTFPENPINPFPPSSFHISNEGTLKKLHTSTPPSPSTVKKIIINKKYQGGPFLLQAGVFQPTPPPIINLYKKITPYPLHNEKNISRKPYYPLSPLLLPHFQ